jgi:hypothetical protein
VIHWIHVHVDRLLSIDRGHDIVLCDRSERLIGDRGGELLIGLSPESLEHVRRELDSRKEQTCKTS